MQSIKFISFNDVHISSINPEARLGDYKQDILDKLNQIKTVGKKLSVDFFVFAGDLFNLKAPMRNPHELNTILIELFKSFPSPVYATEGNHDLRNDNYETFDEQPLRVIYASGALKQIRNEKLTINGISINLRGFPFQETPKIEEMPRSSEDKSDVKICALHLYSSPTGGNLYKSKVYSYDTISVLGDDIFILGHYHIDQGISVRETDGKKQYFCNLGAISRGVLVEDNITRMPKIGLFTIEKDDNKKIKITHQTVRLNVKKAEEVFDLVKKEEELKQSKEAEEFVNKLKENVESTEEDGDPVENELKNLDLEQIVLNKVKELILEADLALKEIEK